MSDRDALLAAITANPDDDLPRLVYADWLEEYGEAGRAEFIRVQCRTQHMRRGDEGLDDLLNRENELRAELFPHLQKLGTELVFFRRGFLERVASGVLNFREHAAALTPDLAPAFELDLSYWTEDDRDRELLRADREAYCEALGASLRRPELRRCVSLALPGVGEEGARQALSSPQLTNLRRLDYSSSEAGPELKAVAGATFANLRWLDLRDGSSANGSPELWWFTRSPHLAKLEHLNFCGNHVRGDHLQALTEEAEVPHLRHLDLSHNDLTAFDASHCLFFNRSERMPALEELDLSQSFEDLTDLTDAAEEPLERDRHRRPYFGRLTKLRLCNCGITDAGARVLAQYPGEVKLTLLDLRGNPIGAAGERALSERFGKDVCVFRIPWLESRL
jgi:uncharacterized protein (TIGR02996 family)